MSKYTRCARPDRAACSVVALPRGAVSSVCVPYLSDEYRPVSEMLSPQEMTCEGGKEKKKKEKPRTTINGSLKYSPSSQRMMELFPPREVSHRTRAGLKALVC